MSTLTPLASLNVGLHALAEHIMASFILSLATRNTIVIGILDLHGIPSVSIHGDLVHSNITQFTAYEISKHQIIQDWDDCNLTHTSDWDDCNLTHTSDWDEMGLILFKRARENYHPHDTFNHEMHE